MSQAPPLPPDTPPQHIASDHARGELALRLRGVTKHFGKGAATIHALRGVDLDVHANRLFMLAGPSGCGKTTLLSVICGVLSADAGEVSVFGTDWASLSEGRKTLRRAELVGYVFQQFNLIPTLAVRENVAVPLMIRGIKRPDALERAQQTLTDVGLGDRGGAMPSQLSGGMQQRVAIARALVGRPRLLVADEPTANLDSHTGHKIMELIKSLASPAAGEPSRCIIVVTHDARVFDFADHIEQMEDGRLVGELPPGETDSTLTPIHHH